MKTQMKVLALSLTLLALFSAAPLASAYYDPGVQRWINRDPLSDAVNPVVSPTARRTPAEAAWGGNTSLFALNKPVQLIDTDGRDWWPRWKWPIWPKSKPQPPPQPTPRPWWWSLPECQEWPWDPTPENCAACCLRAYNSVTLPAPRMSVCVARLKLNRCVDNCTKHDCPDF